jgi:hypothetical protein
MTNDTQLLACGACAHEITFGGISDDAGYLAVTGPYQGRRAASCALCGEPATHVAGYRASLALEVR